MSTVAESTAQLVQDGKFQDALLLLDAAIAQGANAQLWNDWATVQYSCGNLPEAERGYRCALAMDNSNRQAAVNFGLMLCAQGRLQEGLPFLERHKSTLTKEEQHAILNMTAKLRPQPAQLNQMLSGSLPLKAQNNNNLSLTRLLFDNKWYMHALQSCRAAKEKCDTTEDFDKLFLAASASLASGDSLDQSGIDTPLCFIGTTIISTLHFRKLDDPRLQKAAFKQAVDYIDLETSSQCNRRCHYCPNRTHDRFSSNRFLDIALLRKFLLELAEIDYDKELHFVGFNEPLMHRESIIENVKIARTALPHACLVVFTNGDYLTRDYLDELAAAGMNRLLISVHLGEGKSYSEPDILDRVFKLSQQLGTLPALTRFKKGEMISFTLLGGKCELVVNQGDYEHNGYNRAGLLDGIGIQIPVRMAACLNPLRQFVVGFDGAVVPCCTIVHDAPGHQECIIGNIADKTIFDLYASDAYVAWRKALLRLGPKGGVCKTCSGDMHTPIYNDADFYVPIVNYLKKQSNK